MEKQIERLFTIRDHVNRLRARDEEKYNEMMAEIAIAGKLAYFTRTLLVFHNKDLRDVHGIVMNIMKKYLGFLDEDFSNNSVPELPKLEQAA